MNIPLHSSLDVLLFIFFCSFYICSILWIYGDVASRGGGKGMIFPALFVIAGALALVLQIYWALLVWVVGYPLWIFVLRPKEEIELTD